MRSTLLSPSDLPQEAQGSLVDVATHRGAVQPEVRLFTFLGDGETETDSLTFGELDRRARALAAELHRLGASGRRVVLAYPSGLDFIVAFFGSLYAGAVAVPTVLPVGRRALEILETLARDARPEFVLTAASQSAAIARQLAGLETRVASLQELHCGSNADPTFEPRVSPDDLAMIQYTSGSTGAPKGVMLTHTNLMHNQAVIFRHFQHDKTSGVVSWLPMFHDMGLIGTVMQPLYMGRPCTLMSPIHFIERPARWLRAITRYGATTSGAPNFAFDMCVNRIPSEDRVGLDLSRWDLAFNGSEPIRPGTLERFTRSFAPQGFRPEAFYPCYGMAEATLFVSGGPKALAPVIRDADAGALEQHRLGPAAAGAETRAVVASGRPSEEQGVRIVDPDNRRTLPECEIGEIWLRGPSVARATGVSLGRAGRPSRTGPPRATGPTSGPATSGVFRTASSTSPAG